MQRKSGAKNAPITMAGGDSHFSEKYKACPRGDDDAGLVFHFRRRRWS
jgi:hypothetical protein